MLLKWFVVFVLAGGADPAVSSSGKDMKINTKIIYGIIIFLLIFVIFFLKNITQVKSQDKAAFVRTSAPDSEVLPNAREIGRTVPVDEVNTKENENFALHPALNEAEFATLADALGKYDVFERNKALNQLKERASSRENLEPIFSGLFRLSSDHPSFSTLVAALAAVGTPEIQDRLRHILEERDGDWRAYAAVVPAFAFLQQPTAKTIAFLSQRSRHPDPDYASTAALALGAVVRTQHVKGERGGSSLLHIQIDKLKDPNSRIEDIREALAVLGNAGLPETEELIMGYLGTDDPSLRADAALALRFVSSAKSEKALLERLTTEEDLDTRMTIIEALVHRPVSSSGLAAMRMLLSAVPPAPPELREKALDLFFHSELSESENRMNSEWLKKQIAAEPASSVKKKMTDALHMLNQSLHR